MANPLFHPDVHYEIKSSYVWYQEQAEGLGEDFLNELEQGYYAITELYDTWPKINGDYRRYILSKFPYSIIYRKHHCSIFVTAGEQGHHPWQSRIAPCL